MIFNSYAFIVFLAVTLAVYNLIPSNYRVAFLLMAGYFFYAYSDWHNVAILLGVTLSTFLFGRAIGATRKYLIFIVAIIITISPLLLWKIGQLSESLSNRDVAGFIIPIGLSFYTLRLLVTYWMYFGSG